MLTNLCLPETRVPTTEIRADNAASGGLSIRLRAVGRALLMTLIALVALPRPGKGQACTVALYQQDPCAQIREERDSLAAALASGEVPRTPATEKRLLNLTEALIRCEQLHPHKDYWITDMQVVQGVQTNLNTAPLLAQKPTFVRVYVQSNEANHGPWTDITARLVVRDPQTKAQIDELLPVTPRPNYTITVSPVGSHPDKWGDSFTFLLNYQDTTPGERELYATIYSLSTGPEPNPSPDHVWTLDPTFSPPVYVSVYGVVWACLNSNDNGCIVGPAAPWSDYAAHQAYVANAHPVSDFVVAPIPGIGTLPPNPQPFSNLTEARAWACQELANLPSGSILNELDNWDSGGLHGLAFCAGTIRTWNASEEQNARDARVGKTMAQEIAHDEGQECHTLNPCDNYPHGDPLLGNGTAHIDCSDIGFDVSGDTGSSAVQLVSLFGIRDQSDNVIETGRVSDFMSYNSPPIWGSTYTYCQLVNLIWPTPAACSYVVTPEPPPGVTGFARPLQRERSQQATATALGRRDQVSPSLNRTEGTFLHVAGRLDNRGQAVFEPFWMIRSKHDIATKLRGKTLSLIVEDKVGKTLHEYDFDLPASEHDQGPAVPFSLIIPFDVFKDAAAKFVLRRDSKVLAERVVPPHYPTVALVAAPKSGETLSGHRTISWKARDPDRNPLSVSVDYSPDAGETWFPLKMNLTGSSVDIYFDNVPGSDRAVIRVRATNGVKTSEIQSLGGFHVPRKAPFVTLLSPAQGAKFTQNQPFIARGSGYSWEDGLIEQGSSYTWSSDRDGLLGSGQWIVIRKLSIGEHTLTLAVRDSLGITTKASVRVTVVGNPTAPSHPGK